MNTLPIDLIVDEEGGPYEISFDDTIFLMTNYNIKEFDRLFKKSINKAIKDKVGKTNKNGRLVIDIKKLYNKSK